MWEIIAIILAVLLVVTIIVAIRFRRELRWSDVQYDTAIKAYSKAHFQECCLRIALDLGQFGIKYGSSPALRQPTSAPSDMSTDFLGPDGKRWLLAKVDDFDFTLTPLVAEAERILTEHRNQLADRINFWQLVISPIPQVPA